MCGVGAQVSECWLMATLVSRDIYKWLDDLWLVSTEPLWSCWISPFRPSSSFLLSTGYTLFSLPLGFDLRLTVLLHSSVWSLLSSPEFVLWYSWELVPLSLLLNLLLFAKQFELLGYDLFLSGVEEESVGFSIVLRADFWLCHDWSLNGDRGTKTTATVFPFLMICEILRIFTVSERTTTAVRVPLCVTLLV
jgi:hypothetical protein